MKLSLRSFDYLLQTQSRRLLETCIFPLRFLQVHALSKKEKLI